MKFIFRLFVFLAAISFVLVAVIKYVKGCSWKDAVGIVEELWIEMKESCPFTSDAESTT